MIIWKYKDGVDPAETGKKIKAALEGLVGKIDGLIKMEIVIDKFSSSSWDLMMDSTFENEDALIAYQSHPLHLEAANGLVRPNVDVRLSLDYEV